MNPTTRAFVITATLVLGAAGSALAAEGSVTIDSPADGAVLDSTMQNSVSYAVNPGPNGDHVHLYVDDREAAILRSLKGSYTLDAMPPGPHAICVKVVNRNHTPIGVEKCVAVVVK